MKPPSKLYRYRPLSDALLERELGALQDSFLFSPSFSDMNDPMEAFYETGSSADPMLDALLARSGKNTGEMYEMLSETLEKFGLVSFASSYQALPLWAYYGSNFGGMCLEFDAEELTVSDFKGESFRRVTYARTPLPPLTIADLTPNKAEEEAIRRLTRKRIEWAHEGEWRYVTGCVGRKHYLDDALQRVFLGPRVNAVHAERICEVLDRRPVEVLQGVVDGFELTFRTIKPARPFEGCDRVGAGKFDPAEDLRLDDLQEFLSVPVSALFEECHRTALRPNMEGFAGIDLSRDLKSALYIWTTYKLRNGNIVWHQRFFDRRFRPVHGPVRSTQ